MTLNITVAATKRIYQCADFRFQDWPSGEVRENPGNQKIRFAQAFRWRATVSFNGVGSFDGRLVGDWLLERLVSIGPSDPFDRLLEELRTFDSWLVLIPPEHKRHSFSVGAFLGTRPMLALVSNYEHPKGGVSKDADNKLTVHTWVPDRPSTFVYGQGTAVTRDERWNLANLAAVQKDSEAVSKAIAEVNRKASTRNPLVSAGCFVNYITHTGGGGGLAHGIEATSLPLAVSPAEWAAVQGVMADLGFRGRVGGFAIGTSESTDEHHQAMLNEKPNDASTHSNYGAFLKDKKGDAVGAERAYRRALELDPSHALALGNLAGLLIEAGRKEEGEACYERALDAEPGQEHNTWKYVTYLLREGKSQAKIRELLDTGVKQNPQSARLRIKRGFLNLRERRGAEALADFMGARDVGGDQKQVEPGIAFSLHLSGAPIDECIAAYRTAIAILPNDGALKLNLAQLLFIKRSTQEAARLLEEGLRAGVDASVELEALFYKLAHLPLDTATVDRVRRLYANGARLDWDVRQNIAVVRQQHPTKAVNLDALSAALARADGANELNRVLATLAHG